MLTAKEKNKITEIIQWFRTKELRKSQTEIAQDTQKTYLRFIKKKKSQQFL